MSPLTNCAVNVDETELVPCDPAGTEGLEAAENCAQAAEKEAEPVMAEEQAEQAPEPDGDNNGLGELGSEPRRPAEKLADSAALGSAEEAAGMERNGALAKSGLISLPKSRAEGGARFKTSQPASLKHKT